MWIIWIASFRWGLITWSWSITVFISYHFFFFTRCNITCGETSLEKKLSVEDSLFLRFFFLSEDSFEIRSEENSCLSLAEEFPSLLLYPSRLTSQGFLSLLLTTMTRFLCISWLSILFGLWQGTYCINSLQNCRFKTSNVYVSCSELLSLWQKLGRGVGHGLKYYLRRKMAEYSIHKILWNKIWSFDRLWPCKHFNVDQTIASVALFLKI